MKPIELHLPEATPSLNVLIHAGAHWSHYHQARKHWSMLMLVAKNQARITGSPRYPKVEVVIERYGRRMLDDDNFRGGLKVVIDALKDVGLILDDSPKHITTKATQTLTHKLRSPSCTKIKLTVLDPGMPLR